MRGATRCAQNLKQLVRSLRTKLGKVDRPSTGDPISQMILGILSRNTPESKARDALDRLRATVVDYNELRVVPSIELAELVSGVPNARRKCEDLSRALNGVFAVEHSVSLDRLAELPRKETIAYLQEIDGLDAYSRARVRLLGLQQHAIPLDEAMWAYARKVEIVDRRCPLDEAQAFLERQIDPGDALELVALLNRQAWAEMGPAVRRGEVERIESIPPDRTSRNMLRLVAGAAAASSDDESDVRPESAGKTRTPQTATARAKAKAGSKRARPKAAAKKKRVRSAARAPAKRRSARSARRSAKTSRTKPKRKTAKRRVTTRTPKRSKKTARSRRKVKSA